MSRLDCCPFLIITVLHLLPAEHSSSAIRRAVASSPLSSGSAGKSARGRNNNGVCMPESHTSINTKKCKFRGHCSGMNTITVFLNLWRDGSEAVHSAQLVERVKR